MVLCQMDKNLSVINGLDAHNILPLPPIDPNKCHTVPNIVTVTSLCGWSLVARLLVFIIACVLSLTISCQCSATDVH